MAGELRLTLLGEPQVTLDGAPLTGFISAKAQALLFYLAVTGQPHSRETLAGLLWGDMPEVAARKNLTKALSNLRRLIGPFLTVDRHTALFNLEPAGWLDVHLLESGLPQADLAALHQIVDLYQGDFLAGFYVKDAPDFEAWVLTQRERLRELALQARQRVADQLAAGGDIAAAIEVTNRLLALDPLHEAGHRLLMSLLARSGRRSAALAHYETCRRILAEELGAEPMAETQALYDRLKAAGDLPPHNLPLQTTPFVGREPELAQLSTMLADPACRLLTIAGPGGIGKTRLALQVAGRYLEPERALASLDSPGFADGVYFVPLASLESAEALVPTLAEALDFTFQHQGQPRQQLLNFLRHKTALLVLDSFEHTLAVSPTEMDEAVALVTDILRRAPGIKVLTTSRVRLQAQGEQLFTLVGLDVPEMNGAAKPKGQPTAYSAIRLFEQCARRLRPEFALTPTELVDVVRICRLAEGMPLGIMLAAAWIEVLTPAEIAIELSQNLDFLEIDWRDVPPRQRSIRAVFDQSWQLLTAQEQAVFQQLSIFSGEFTRQAAHAVTGASLRELMALVNKSLLLTTAFGRYTIHELLRQYGLEKLDQSEAGDAARDRHLAYYASFMQARAVDVRGARQQAALVEIEAERENIRAAWSWAVSRGQAIHLRWMCDPLSQFYVWRGRYQEGEIALRQAVAQLRGTTVVEDLYVLGKLLIRQSVFNRYLGRVEVALELLYESLTLWDSPALAGVEGWVEKAFALLQLGETVRDSNRLEAKRCYEKSLALFQASDFPWGMAQALAALGWLIQHFGAYDEAKHLYQESLAIHQSLGNEAGVASALMWLGGITLYQGYPEEAETLVRQSMVIRQKMGNRAGVAQSLSKLGETLTWLGKFAGARDLFEESRLIYDNLGLRSAAAFSQAMLGQAHLHLAHIDPARAAMEQALNSFRKFESQRGIGYALLGLGSSALAQQTDAQALLLESLSIYREIGQRDELGQALALLGYAAHRQGDFSAARQYLAEALQTALEIQAFMPMMLALPAEALLALEQGQGERAVELSALVWRYPFVANSAWFEGMAGPRIAAVTAALPAEVVADAKARGRAKALEAAVVEILNE